MYGTTHAHARELLTGGKHEDLYREILDKFRALERSSDIVICVGTDYRMDKIIQYFNSGG